VTMIGTMFEQMIVTKIGENWATIEIETGTMIFTITAL